MPMMLLHTSALRGAIREGVACSMCCLMVIMTVIMKMIVLTILIEQDMDAGHAAPSSCCRALAQKS